MLKNKLIALLLGVMFGVNSFNSFNLYASEFGDVYSAHPAAGGMGNAVTATVSNTSSVFYNVAGLGRLSEADLINAGLEKKKAEADAKITTTVKEEKFSFKESVQNFLRDSKKDLFVYKEVSRPSRFTNELSLQYNYALPRLGTTAPQNQDLSKLQDNYAGLGLSINLNNIYDFKRTVKFGLGLNAPATGNLLTINDVNVNAHRYLQYGVSNQRPSIQSGIGVEVWKDRLFVGVGFTALASGNGAILLKDVPLSPNQVIPNQQVILEVKPFANPIYGAQFHYGKFMLGVSYRRETAMAVNSLPARAQTTLLGIQLDFDVSMYDMFSPRKWAYGIAYKPIERLTIAVDINRELWSAYRVSRTKANYTQKFYFDDITYARIGAEFNINKFFKFRTGFTNRPSPVPMMYGDVNLIDFKKTIVTAGLSLTLFPGMRFLENLKNPVVIDVVAEMQKMQDVSVIKLAPSDKNPIYTAGGSAVHIGGSVTTFF